MENCKAAGADLVQDCWFKKLTPINIRWQEYQEDCVCQGNIPEWIFTGRTVLIQKDPLHAVADYRDHFYGCTNHLQAFQDPRMLHLI